MTRADKGAELPRIEVVAAVFYRDGEVLACRRAPGKSAAGKWEFPGGKIDDDDETSELALGIARIGHESRAAGGSCIPSVDGPCSTDQTADDDDRAG